MTRILIVYATHFGQTRKIADEIARVLRERGISVELADASNQHRPDPRHYDLVVLGSRIEMGRHASALETYVRENLEALRAIPTAVFVVCNAATPDAGPDPSGYVAAFCDVLGLRPTLRASIAGALRYRSYNWILRFVMKRIARAAGHPTDTSRDHEMTDWTKVEAFAHRIADVVVRPAAAQSPA